MCVGGSFCHGAKARLEYKYLDKQRCLRCLFFVHMSVARVSHVRVCVQVCHVSRVEGSVVCSMWVCLLEINSLTGILCEAFLGISVLLRCVKDGLCFLSRLLPVKALGYLSSSRRAVVTYGHTLLLPALQVYDMEM